MHQTAQEKGLENHDNKQMSSTRAPMVGNVEDSRNNEESLVLNGAGVSTRCTTDNLKLAFIGTTNLRIASV